MDWVFNVFQVIFLKSMLGTAESEPWNTKIRTFPYVSWPKWVSTFQQNVSWHQHWPSCNSSVKICKIPRSKSWNANPVTILNCRKTSWTSTYPHRPVAKWVAHVCHSSLSTQRWKTKPEQPQKGDGWLMGKWFSLKSSFLKEKINKLRHSSPAKHDLMFPSYSSYACWRTSVHIYIHLYRYSNNLQSPWTSMKGLFVSMQITELLPTSMECKYHVRGLNRVFRRDGSLVVITSHTETSRTEL